MISVQLDSKQRLIYQYPKVLFKVWQKITKEKSALFVQKNFAVHTICNDITCAILEKSHINVSSAAEGLRTFTPWSDINVLTLERNHIYVSNVGKGKEHNHRDRHSVVLSDDDDFIYCDTFIFRFSDNRYLQMHLLDHTGSLSDFPAIISHFKLSQKSFRPRLLLMKYLQKRVTFDCRS